MTVFRAWRGAAEPRASWFVIFFCALPINIMCGMDVLGLGIYYVEYVEYFGVSSATVGIISAISAVVMSLSGESLSLFKFIYNHTILNMQKMLFLVRYWTNVN